MLHWIFLISLCDLHDLSFFRGNFWVMQHVSCIKELYNTTCCINMVNICSYKPHLWLKDCKIQLCHYISSSSKMFSRHNNFSLNWIASSFIFLWSLYLMEPPNCTTAKPYNRRNHWMSNIIIPFWALNVARN